MKFPSIHVDCLTVPFEKVNPFITDLLMIPSFHISFPPTIFEYKYVAEDNIFELFENSESDINKFFILVGFVKLISLES